jgi:hypothetical protein
MSAYIGGHMRQISERSKSVFFLAILTFLGILGSSEIWAKPSYYGMRTQPLLLPTGCKLGWGPQYQSFDGRLGQIFEENGWQIIEFNPIQVCKAASKICTSQLPGPSCCLNACKQNNTDLSEKSQTGEAFDEAGYLACTEKCVGAPSYETESLKGKSQLESKIEMRFRGQK